MTRGVLFAAWLLLAATGSLAQTVSVRSADHDGFSRIVLHLPGRLSWHWEDGPEGKTLKVGDKGMKFDISGIHDRMSSDRVISVVPVADPPGLRFALACDCVVATSWHGTAMLVVDISGPVPEPAAEHTPPAALPPMASQAAVALAAPGIAPQLWPEVRKIPETGGSPVLLPPGGEPRVDAILTSAREVLVRQIARAAGLGLLTVQEGGMASTPAPPTPPSEADGAHHVGKAHWTPPASRQPDPHLMAETSVDQAAGLVARGEIASDGSSCLPDHLLNVPDWGNSDSFALQLGPLRRSLVEEFDRVQPTVASDLVQLYLYFGFGAEAAQVLDLHASGTEEEAVLRAMAAVLDGVPAEGILTGQTDCDSDAALWSALSSATLPPDALLNLDAMLRTLNRLPPHLRGIVAPQLARKLLASDRLSAAERVLRILDRAPVAVTPVQTMLRAETTLAMSEPEAADMALGKVVEANEDAAAEALIRRIDRRLHLGQTVPREMAELAGAYAQEQRDTPTGRELARAYLEAVGAAGDFSMAFNELERLSPDLAPETQDRVLSTLLELLADAADDLTFINHALRLRDAAPERIAPEAANNMARRLVDLGFPSEASSYLRPAASGPAMQNRQLLRAEIALAQGWPHQAQVELLGLTGEDANLLRARAHGMLGKHRAAHSLYLASGQGDRAVSEAILAGNWEQLETMGDPAIAEMARLANAAANSVSPARPEERVLAHDQALLDEAAAVRDTVARLLASRPAPEVAD